MSCTVYIWFNDISFVFIIIIFDMKSMCNVLKYISIPNECMVCESQIIDNINFWTLCLGWEHVWLSKADICLPLSCNKCTKCSVEILSLNDPLLSSKSARWRFEQLWEYTKKSGHYCLIYACSRAWDFCSENQIIAQTLKWFQNCFVYDCVVWCMYCFYIFEKNIFKNSQVFEI